MNGTPARKSQSSHARPQPISQTAHSLKGSFALTRSDPKVQTFPGDAPDYNLIYTLNCLSVPRSIHSLPELYNKCDAPLKIRNPLPECDKNTGSIYVSSGLVRIQRGQNQTSEFKQSLSIRYLTD